MNMAASIQSSFSATIPLTADRVWRALKNYGDLSWAKEAGIEEVVPVGEGIGMVRKVRMAGQSTWILERLVSLDEDAMSLSYVIDEDGWPGLRDYAATAKITPGSGNCELRWSMSARVEPAQEQTMQLGLDAMAEGIVTLFAAQFEAAVAG